MREAIGHDMCIQSSVLHHVVMGENYEVLARYGKFMVIRGRNGEQITVPSVLFRKQFMFVVECTETFLSLKAGEFYKCVHVSNNGKYYTLLDGDGVGIKAPHNILKV